MMVLWLVAFPIMMITFDGIAGGHSIERHMASLLGFLVWDLCMGVLASTVQSVTQEARQGTLEAVLLVPVAPGVLFFIRFMAAFVRQGVETFALGVTLMVVLRLPFIFNSVALMVLFLTILGVIGVGLALVGLALVYKQIDSVVAVITLLAVLFTGALVPLNSLGLIFQAMKFTLPTIWGIDLLRQVTLNGSDWVLLMANGDWPGLVLQTAIFLFLGINVFNWGFRRALYRGSLNAY